MSLRRHLANVLRRLKFAGVARGAVMKVALHVAMRTGQHDATHAVAGLRVAADKAVRIAVGPGAAIGRDGRPFGVVNSVVRFQRSSFALDGQLN